MSELEVDSNEFFLALCSAAVKGENTKDGETKKKKKRKEKRRIFLCLIRVLKRKIKKKFGGG